MKVSKQEEYGLRILVLIARAGPDEGLSIPQLSELEGLSEPYVAKLTRAMRLQGLVQSTRGHKGGYVLAKSADQITISEILIALGGSVFEEDYRRERIRAGLPCTHTEGCPICSLWKTIQHTLDRLLGKITLADLSSNPAKKGLLPGLDGLAFS